MCENDAAVDAWFRALDSRCINHARDEIGTMKTAMTLAVSSGTCKGVIRELAATVPGVREWLVANMPGEG